MNQKNQIFHNINFIFFSNFHKHVNKLKSFFQTLIYEQFSKPLELLFYFLPRLILQNYLFLK
jgi:hypothetical protein